MGQSKRWFILFLCIVAAGGLAAALLLRRPPVPVQLATGTLIRPARALPDFNLIDEQGRAFGPKNLRGRWSILFFGYTNCPDYCPTTLAALAAMQKQLRAAKSVLPQVIFVSVDAKRDTPAQLAKYVPYFDSEFIGLTAADQASIEAFAKEWGVAVLVHPAADGNYTVDHSGELFVLDPAGKLAAILTGPFAVAELQGDLRRIVAGGA